MSIPVAGTYNEFVKNRFMMFIEESIGMQLYIRICTITLLLIHIFERPMWTYKQEHEQRWSYVDVYPSYGLSQLPAMAGKVLEIIAIIGCFYGIYVQENSSKYSLYLNRRKIFKYVTIPLLCIQFLAAIINIGTIAYKNKPILSLSPLEAILFFSFEPAFESSLSLTIVRVIPYFTGLIGILVCIIASWAVFGMVVTSDVYKSSDPGFTSFGGSMWTMLTVLNAANWPGPMIPTFSINRGYFFFFMFYVVIVQWGFLSLILGLIINFFETIWEDTNESQVNDEASVRGWKSHATLNSNKSRKKPDHLIHNKHNNETLSNLDENASSTTPNITTPSVNVNSIIPPSLVSQNSPEEIEIEQVDMITFLEKMRLVRSSFSYKFGTDILFFAIGVLFCTVDKPEIVLIIQLLLKSLEITFSILARRIEEKTLLEWYNNSRNAQNLWLYLILLSFSCVYFGLCANDSIPNLGSDYALSHSPNNTVFGTQCLASDLNRTMQTNQNHVLIFSIIVIRTVVFIRICMVVRNIGWELFADNLQNELKRIGNIIMETSEGITYLIIIIFVLMYIFATIGQYMFGGHITINSPNNSMQEELNGSLYGQSQYWALNFNDMPSGMFTLFTLLYVNNMQVTTSGFTAATSQYAQIFFWLWYVIGVLLFMNIFTAFVWSRVGKVLDDTEGYKEELDEQTSVIRNSIFGTPEIDNAEVSAGQGHESDIIRQSELSIRASTKSRGKKQIMEILFDALSAPAERESILRDSMIGSVNLRQSLLETPTKVQDAPKVYQQQRNPAEINPNLEHSTRGLTDISMSYPVYNRPNQQPNASQIEAAKRYTREQNAQERGIFAAVASILPNMWKFKSKVDNNAPHKVKKSINRNRNRKQSMQSWIKGDVDMAAHECSAVLLQYARHGEVHTLFTSRQAMHYFRMRCLIAYPLLIAAWLLTFMRILQKPLWLLQCSSCDLKDYPMSISSAFISPKVNLLLKFPLLLILLVGFVLETLYKIDSRRRLWTLKASILLRYIFTIITVLHMILIIVGAFEVNVALEIDWCLSIMSVFYIFWFDRNALRKIIILFGMLPKVLLLAFFFCLFVLIMAAGADFIFSLSFLDVDVIENIDDDYLGGGYYITFVSSAWSTFVAMTSSSFPNQIVPSVNSYREFSVFVIVFIVFGAWVMLDVALAMANFEFQRGVRFKEAYEERAASELIASAFDLMAHATDLLLLKRLELKQEIDETNNKNKNTNTNKASHIYSIETALAEMPPHISPVIFGRLLEELYGNYNDFRKGGIPNTPMRTLLVNILDLDGDGNICTDDFNYFLHCSKIKLKQLPNNWRSNEEVLKFQMESIRNYDRDIANPDMPIYTYIYRLVKYKRLLITTWYFNLGKNTNQGGPAINCIVNYLHGIKKYYWDALGDSIAGVFCTLACLSQRDLNVYFVDRGLTIHRNLVIIMCSFFLFEFFIKWLFLGIKLYFQDFRNRMDFGISVATVVILIIGLFTGIFSSIDLSRTQRNISNALEIITLLRLLLYPRNIACFANPVKGISWNTVFSTVGKLVFTFAECFICVGFTYAQVGCWLYGGLIPVANINYKLDRSPYGQNNFYTLNFNDMPGSLYTLFSCVRVSDFDTITSGLVTVTKTRATRCFFVVWYIIGTLLLLNIVKSYFICVFQTRNLKSVLPEEKNINNVSFDSPIKNNKSRTTSAIESELDMLETLNVSSDFIISLSALSRQPNYISLHLDTDTSADINTIIEDNYNPVFIEKTISEDSLNVDDANNLPKHDILDSLRSSQENAKQSYNTCPWETITNNDENNSRKYAFVANIPYARDMNPHVRLVILRRLKKLSDLSKLFLGREEYIEENKFTDSMGTSHSFEIESDD
jgi:hypothetical protein